MKSISRTIMEHRGIFSTPSSVQGCIPVRKVYEDGLFLIGNQFTKSIRFSDINYTNLSEEDRLSAFISQAKLINMFDDHAYTKITVFTRRADLEKAAREAAMPQKGDGLDGLREEINRYLRENIESSEGFVQDKYLTLSVNEKTVDDARIHLNRQAGILRDALMAAGSDCTEVSLYERLKIFHDFYRSGSPGEFRFDMADIGRKGHSFLDSICPDSFRFRGNWFTMGERFGRVLFLQEFASAVSDELFTALSQRGITMMLSADFYPIPTDKAIRLVENRLLAAQTDKTRWQRKQNDSYNFSADPPFDLEQRIADISEMLGDLRNRDQKLIMTTVTLVHLADSREELDSDTQELIKTADRFSCTLSPLGFQQLEGLNTVLPFGGTVPISATRTFTTESAVAVTFPYSAVIVNHEYGIYAGSNPLNRSPIMINRKQLKNANAFYLGSPGGGKSFKAKETAIQILLRDDDTDVIFVDPDNEYTGIVREFGGIVCSFSAGSESCTNPLEINRYYNADENGRELDPLPLKSDLVLSLFEAILGRNGLNASDKSLIDRCLRNILLPVVESDYTLPCPVLGDLRKELLEQKEPAAGELASALELFTEGSLDIFNKGSSLNENGARVLSFEYSRIGTQLKGIGTLFALDAIQNRITSNMMKGRTTFVIYDEVSYIYQHELAGEFLQTQFRRARKYGAMLTGMTQNVTDVLKSDTAATMLANSELLVTFGQDGSDLARLKELLKLSDYDTERIRNSKEGEGLIKVGRTFIPFEDRFPKDTKLYELMTTKPGERQ